MLPTIKQYACAAFRHLRGDSRDDAVEEAIANALVAYVRLVELKKTEVAHPRSWRSTLLRKSATADGSKPLVREVLSYAQPA
jgi:hypothetical protein